MAISPAQVPAVQRVRASHACSPSLPLRLSLAPHGRLPYCPPSSLPRHSVHRSRPKAQCQPHYSTVVVTVIFILLLSWHKQLLAGNEGVSLQRFIILGKCHLVDNGEVYHASPRTSRYDPKQEFHTLNTKTPQLNIISHISFLA